MIKLELYRGVARRVWAPPKNFEPCSRCGSKLWGGGCTNPPGYAPGAIVVRILSFGIRNEETS